MINFQQQETTEIRNRIRAAWATFHKYRQEQQKDKTNEEKDTDDMSSTGDESEDGQSSNTYKDQDIRERYGRRN